MTYQHIRLNTGWMMTEADFDRFASDAIVGGELDAEEAAALKQKWLIAPWKIDGYWQEPPEVDFSSVFRVSAQ